jgi:hypothetical protein
MDPTSLSALVARLYTVVHLLSGYPVPETPPAVQLLPRAEIERLVCAGPCQIRAYYHPDFGVVVDQSLNLESNRYHQSILLHELVHHAQHVAGAFDHVDSNCEARVASERQAYDIQNRFLARLHVAEPIPVPRWQFRCSDE